MDSILFMARWLPPPHDISSQTWFIPKIIQQNRPSQHYTYFFHSYHLTAQWAIWIWFVTLSVRTSWSMTNLKNESSHVVILIDRLWVTRAQSLYWSKSVSLVFKFKKPLIFFFFTWPFYTWIVLYFMVNYIPFTLSKIHIFQMKM